MLVALMCLPLSMRGQDTVTISSASDWVSLCENYSGKEVNVLLGCDLTLSDASKSMDDFRGTFDGQGHTISFSMASTATNLPELFNTAQGTIKNLRLSGTVTSSGGPASASSQYNLLEGVVPHFVGSVTGAANNDPASLTFDNCHNDATFTYTGTAAVKYADECGFVRYVKYGTITFTDCSYQGAADCNGLFSMSGFIDYTESSTISFIKSLSNFSRATNMQNGSARPFVGDNLLGFASSVTYANTYYVGSSTTTLEEYEVNGATKATADELTSGALTYALNNGRTGDDAVWMQTVGTDETPQPRTFSPDSKEVFRLDGSTRSGSSNHWTTLYYPADVTLPDGVEQYTIHSVEGSYVNAACLLVSTVKALTPVLLYASGGLPELTLPTVYYNEFPTQESGLLMGVTEETAANEQVCTLSEVHLSNSCLPLFNHDNKTISAWHCYLNYSEPLACAINRAGVLITTKDEWNAFKAQYDGTEVNAWLGTDLTLTDDDAPMTTFKGTFDGQGHTITVDYSRGTESSIHAPFQQAAGTIKNLQLTGTISTDAYALLYASPLVSLVGGSKTEVATLNIENCHSDVVFQEDKGNGFMYANGFVRYASTNAKVNFTDCSFTGAFHTTGVLYNVGCFVGYTVNGTSAPGFSFTKCFSDASGSTFSSINCYNGASYLIQNVKGSNSLTITNCSAVKVGDFYAPTWDGTGSVNLVDSATAASGSQAYALNAGRTGSDAVWMQTIGTDTVPQLKLFAEASMPVRQATDTVRIGTAGWATHYYPVAKALPEGVTAYKFSGVSTEKGAYVVSLEQVSDTIPASTPVLLCTLGKGQAEATKAITIDMPAYYYNTPDEEDIKDNGQAFQLVGVTRDTQAFDGCYVLQQQDNKTAFYRVDERVATPTVPAWKCMLVYNSEAAGGESGDAKAIHLRLDDEATAINAVNAINGILGDGYVYDLQGRRVQSLQKGVVYIKNGQKFIVR